MKDPFKISVNDRFQFDIAPNEALEMDIVPNGTQVFQALRNGQSYQIELIEANYHERYFHLEVNGHRFKVQISDYYEQLIQQMGLNTSAVQKQNIVKAPMPGLVLQINVVPGQNIQKGDTLLILEAMKMENVIKATNDAVVKSVNVQKGTAVEKGQLLLEME